MGRDRAVVGTLTARLPAILLAALLTAGSVAWAQQRDDGREPSRMETVRPAGDTLRTAGIAHTDTLTLGAGDTLRLTSAFVQRESLQVRVLPALDAAMADSLAAFERDSSGWALDSSAWTLDARSGMLVLRAGTRARFGDVLPRIVVTYRALPLALRPVYRIRELVSRRDTTATGRGDSLRVAVPVEPLSIESIFGPDLQKSGYLGRGFTVGTNRDLTLSSGFRLQLSGKLADDISVTAALTDENTPIQPEGSTRTIQELDKVFVRIEGGQLAATLGDFVLTHDGTEFGRYNRKLSGFLGEGATSFGDASASFATLKGTFHTVQFNGIDGTQGPYRLTGKSGEQRILVLAGTERVYVDGVEMVRGETHDYVIEYASGEVTFKPRRLITSYSRITVDFEYADRQYTRTLLTATGSGRVFDDRLRITARYIREGDDQDAPLDLQLSDDDKRILEAAGDDPAKAVASGVSYAGIDSVRGTGAGQYERRDTLIAGEAVALYRYAPGTDSALWSLSFSFVGSGRGSYTRKALGIYTWTGVGRGDYDPVRVLPLPQLQQLGDLRIDARPFTTLSLSAEGAISALDRNRFSAMRDVAHEGGAVNGTVRWTPTLDGAGAFDLSARYRATDATFMPIDRINTIEFSRMWDVGSALTATEILREASLAYKPTQWIDVRGGGGSLSKGSFTSTRLEASVHVMGDTSAWRGPSMSWTAEHIGSADGAASTRGSWLRQRGEVSQRFGIAEPRVRIEHEHRRAHAGASDTLSALSMGFVDVRPGLQLRASERLTVGADVGVRMEDAWLAGAVVRQSTDLLQQYSASFRTERDFSATGALTVRSRAFSEQFRLRGNKDVQTILTRVQVRHTPFERAISTDLLYEVSTERTSRMERQFLRVPYGQGNYIYLGDLNENGIPDESEFEPTRFDGEYVLVTVPTDELFPVIDLRASARVQVQPSRVISPGASGLLAGMLRALSSESVLRVEEKSSDEQTSNMYLLRFARFLNDSTTIRGFQNMRQDLFLFEQSQDFSMRLRFDQSRGFSQYALASERSYRRERSVRVRMQLVREIGVQGDVALIDDVVASPGAGNRARDIDGTSMAADVSYRPYPKVEVGFVFSSRMATDRQPTVPLEAQIDAQILRLALTLDGPGRVRIELERSDVVLSSSVAAFPFELTDGRSEGKSWIVRANVDYRLTSYLQATMSYLGRSEGGRPFLHTMRAEVRAFF